MKNPYPEIWNDENELSTYFTPLPSNDNPKEKNRLVNFWTKTIRLFALHNSLINDPSKTFKKVTLSKRIIEVHFTHPIIGTPMCIQDIIIYLLENNILFSKKLYFVNQNWLHYIKSLFISHVYDEDEKLFYLDILVKFSHQFHSKLLKCAKNYSDQIFIVCNLKDDLDYLHEDDLSLILQYLNKIKKIYYFKLENNIEAFKVNINESDPLNISNIDYKIAQLKYFQNRIIMEQNTIMNKINIKKDSIKSMLKIKQKDKALTNFKILKQLEDILEKRNINSNNIELILCEINSAFINKMTLESIKIGADTIKSLKDSLKWDVEKIEEQVFELNENMMEINEMSHILEEPDLIRNIEKPIIHQNNYRNVESKQNSKDTIKSVKEINFNDKKEFNIIELNE